MRVGRRSPFARALAFHSTYTVRQSVATGGIIAHFLAIPPPAPVLGMAFARTN